VDNIFAVKMPRLDILNQDSPRWPENCEFLEQRKCGDLPTNQVIKQVTEAGCHIVPKSSGVKYPKTWRKLISRTFPGCGYENGTWRISFSVSEKILANSFTFPQRRSFLILKLLLKTISTNYNEKMTQKWGLGNFKKVKFPSFVLKHVMFWTLESVTPSEWRLNNLHTCVKLIIMRYMKFLERKMLPHYFFGEEVNLLLPGEKDVEDLDEIRSCCRREKLLILHFRK
jgi:hypothetical protein